MNPSKPTERSIIADITALLPGLSEDGTRRVQAEVNIALAGAAAKDYTACGRNAVRLSRKENLGGVVSKLRHIA